MATVYLTYANNPADPSLSSLREERNEVGRSLDPCQKDGRIILRQEDNTQLNEVLTGLNRHCADLIIFGFSGHAGKATLSFTDKDGNGSTIAHLLRKEACPHLKLVLLNGCATIGQVAALEEAGVPIVIATSAPVEDKAAKDFAVLFFENLAGGKTVRFAFEQAKATFSAAAGKADPFLISSGENRGMVLRETKDKTKPAWVFSCKEKRFEEWTLEMGIKDPRPPLSSISRENPPVRLLMIGGKYAKELEDRFKPEVEKKELAIYSINLEEVALNEEKVKRELCHADAVVFTIDGGHFEGKWSSESFLYVKEFIKDQGVKTVFIKEKWTDPSLEKFLKDIGYPEDNLAIPTLPGYDIETLSTGGKDLLVIQNLAFELKINLVDQLKNRVLTIESRIRPEIEDFDLDQQTEYLGGWQPGKKFSLVLMEGTQKCGLNMLFWKWMAYLEDDLRSQRFGLYFNSDEGHIESLAILLSRFYHGLFDEMWEEIPSEFFYLRLIEKLRKNPLCLIFDDPLSYEKGGKVLLEFLTGLLDKLLPNQESLQPLFIVVINRSINNGAQVGSLKNHFQPSDLLDIVDIPLITCIERSHFDKWFGGKKSRLKDIDEMKSLNDHANGILIEPYLEPVVSKICLQLGYKQLISKIFQPPLS